MTKGNVSLVRTHSEHVLKDGRFSMYLEKEHKNIKISLIFTIYLSNTILFRTN